VRCFRRHLIFANLRLGKFLKKLIGKKEMEDALKRLDKLTQDEARMAAAEILKLTHLVDNKVTSLINGTPVMFGRPDSERTCLV
jgi:hypothetical protein